MIPRFKKQVEKLIGKTMEVNYQEVEKGYKKIKEGLCCYDTCDYKESKKYIARTILDRKRLIGKLIDVIDNIEKTETNSDFIVVFEIKKFNGEVTLINIGIDEIMEVEILN